MYKQKTIEEVNNLDLVSVIEKYIKLTKSGSTYKGKSPFVDEKTPSFMVSPAKGLWKCFSSGMGGNSPVKFVMEVSKLTWKEAINELAGKFNIQVEYDHEKGEKYLDTFIKIGEIREVNHLALEWFQSQLLNGSEFKKLPEVVLKQASRASMAQIEEFQIGYAPNDFKGLHSHLLSKGVPNELMVQSGLITEKTDEQGTKYFDFFRNRIMFPIFAANGSLLGFSGRAVEWKKEDAFPKVLNSRETELFKKFEVLLGVHIAKHEMVACKTAIKVEGNYDVTAFHEKGLKNTVASLGTAFTDSQAKILKRFAEKVVLAIDNDAAGIKRVEKDLRTLISEGLSVDVWYSDKEGQDPFDYVATHQKLNNEKFKAEFASRCVDGIEYVAEHLFKDTDDLRKKTNAQEALVELLAIVPNATLRKNYIKQFIKKYDITQKDVEEKVSVELASKKAKELEKSESNGFKLPSYLETDEIECFSEYQFYADSKPEKIGYWFLDNKYPERQSNCVIKPIFQAVSGVEKAKFIVEISFAKKGHVQSSIMEWSNEAFFSQQKLEYYLSNKLCYFHGTKRNFQYLTKKLFTQFPVCSEIKVLGWQNDGFYAFANGISDGVSFKEVNSYGICIQGDRNYYLPACSKIYVELNTDDDDYEEDRKFVYRASGTKFSEWARLFNEVYYENGNGMMAISFMLASLFSDHIYSVNYSFPFMYYYGKPKTGKTTMARSVSAVFKKDTVPLNLTQSTPVALISVLQNVRNSIVHFDEFANSLKPEVIETLKGVWDRTGRARGTIKDDKTKQTKIRAAVQVSGQPLPTVNQNAFFTRAILLRFEITEDKRKVSEKKLFDKLDKLQKSGLSDIILEVLKFRDFIVSNFEETQFQLYSDLKQEFEGKEIDGRVQSNVLACATMIKLLGDKLGLPFTFEKYWSVAKELIIDQSAAISETDELMEFFKILEFMYAERRISEGPDFKIETKEFLTVRKGSKESTNIDLGGPTRLIHLSFTRIHPIYSKFRREIFNQIGQSEAELRDIMRMHKAFVGTPAVVDFNGKKSSAYTFKLDMLPVNMEHITQSNDGPPAIGSQKELHGMTPAIEKHGFPVSDDDLPF